MIVQALPPREDIAPPTRVGLIGCGYWGANYVRVLSELVDCELAYVCDQRVARLRELARRCGDALLATDAADVIDAEEVDAVVIATEVHTHYELVRRALLAGKHVLVEKPLSTSATTAGRLIALAEERQRILFVAHTFLYNAAVRKVKELVVNRELGRPYYLYSQRTNLGPIRRDVNALWDLAPHDIAIFNYILDAKPDWASAVGARVLRNEREDVGFISLGYPEGIIGHIHVSWTDPNKVREVVVVGSDKRVVFNDLDAVERVRVFDKGVKVAVLDEPLSFGEYQLLVRDGDITSPALTAVTEPLKLECGHFLHCVRRGDPVFTDGKQGRDVVVVMEAIAASMKRRGAPVDIRWTTRKREARRVVAHGSAR